MSSVRIKKITVEPNESLTIQQGAVIITDTSESTSSLHGALNIHGGVGIYCSYDSVSSTSGGALTIGGGLAVNKTTRLGGNVLLDNISKTFSINGISNSRLFMDTIVNKNFYISPDGNSKRFDLYDDQLLINITTPSTNASSGAFVVSGGISINCTGPSLTVAGHSLFSGESVHDNHLIINYGNEVQFVGSSVGSSALISMQDNDLYLFNDNNSILISAQHTVIQDNLSVTNDQSEFLKKVVLLDTVVSSNASSGSLVVNGGVSISCSKQSLSSTEGGALTVDGGMGIRGSVFVGESIKADKLILYGQVPSFAGLSSVDSGSLVLHIPSTSDSYIFSNDASNKNVFKIKGTNEIVFMNIENTQNYSLLVTDGSLSVSTEDLDHPFVFDFIGNTNGTFVNIKNDLGMLTLTENQLYSTKDLVIQDQMTLKTDGSTTFSGDVSLLKRISISSTEDASSNTFGGALTINGGMSIAKSVHMGSILNIDNVEIFSTSGSLEISASVVIKNTSGTLLSINGTTDTLNVINIGSDIFLQSSSGSLHLIGGSDGSSVEHLFLQTGGNIGIRTTNPNFALDVNGTVNINSISYINGLEIVSNNNAVDVNSKGSLYVHGGATVDKNLIVNGIVSFTDTAESSNTGGAVNIAGGVTISSGQAGSNGAGALTVNGGGYFGGSLYIQQNLDVSGVINGAASSTTFAYVSLTATDEAINLSSGSFVTFGGITTQCYTNAVSTSNGGSFLTPGGASIGKDTYIGGDLYNYGKINMHGDSSSDNLIDIYDIYNTLRFSLDRNVASNNLSITRYDSLGASVEKSIDISNLNGSITLNNTTPSSGRNNASLILKGGLSISTSNDNGSLGNGGALSVFGGMSVIGKTFIGGDTVFSSTTTSTNCSNGSVVLLGGLGVVGSMNVFGNTVFSGNVSIMGTTTSIHSTEAPRESYLVIDKLFDATFRSNENLSVL